MFDVAITLETWFIESLHERQVYFLNSVLVYSNSNADVNEAASKTRNPIIVKKVLKMKRLQGQNENEKKEEKALLVIASTNVVLKRKRWSARVIFL